MISNKWTKFFVSTSIALYLGACAHNIKPTPMAATANPNAEVDNLSAKVDAARTQNVDVLAPENFKDAEKSLKEAQNLRSKNKKGEKILEAVGYGHAYLDRANAAAQKSREQLPDVLKARELAMTAGAAKYHEDRVDLDKDLMKYTRKIEKDKTINREDITDLQQDYLDLELKSIKSNKLSEAKNTLENAEKQGAKRIVPKAYADATEKYKVAEKAIETDRHDEQSVNTATSAATSSAQLTMSLLQTAKENRKRSPEQIAREIENRDQRIDEASALNDAAKAQLTAAEQKIAHERTQLGAIADERQKLEERERFNQAFEQARAEFKQNEADVYRQGDNMIIRLKSMKFSPGRSELPSAALPVLNKVKGVLSQIKAEDVVVEGHTDSTGAATLNKRLSSERAEAVANYFVSENTVESKNVEAIGYGYDRPIASNKNKTGREQNRRVDIIIKPAQASAAQPAQQPGTSSVQ
ncbi:MAG: OmpA family protein [Bdellovibrionaceae bacterium]|nr:OmpA family protein [Pseudobdellovibrionaceae bacterium]